MIKFKIGKCSKCGKTKELMFSNNPLLSTSETICFGCISEMLNYKNLEHADFFCRTYNLPFNPELWLNLAQTEQWDVFKFYTSAVLGEQEDRQNLYYTESTRDLWAKANHEWEKCRSFAELLTRLTPIKESYIERGYLRWGEQYTFEELIKLDSMYSRTLKSNNITNPMQKEAIKTLCKLQIQMDEAIRAGDPKAIKDFSSAWSTFAKEAALETMINESKTDDITTVAELFQYGEDQGFKFRYFDGADKDEADRAITDIQEANRRLILEATGLQAQLEEMIRQRTESKEQTYAQEVVENSDLKKLLDINIDNLESDIDAETDEAAISLDLNDMDPDTPVIEGRTTIIRTPKGE